MSEAVASAGVTFEATTTLQVMRGCCGNPHPLVRGLPEDTPCPTCGSAFKPPEPAITVEAVVSEEEAANILKEMRDADD